MPMKAYKGFNKDMTCRGFQYKEGETYETKEAVLCKSGFHACEAPLDCFGYYDPSESEYHEVELEDVSGEREENNTKVCAKKIKIGAKLSIAKLCNLQFEYVKSHCTNENNADYGKPATAGDCGAATSRGSVSVGENGVGTVRGNNCRAKGGIGAVIVIVEEVDDSYDIYEWKAGVIDGVNLKPDTWYMLKNGKFTEVED